MLHIKDSGDACDTWLAVLAMHFSRQTDTDLYIYKRLLHMWIKICTLQNKCWFGLTKFGIWGEENKEKDSNGKVRKLSQNRHRTQINIMLP